MEANASNAIDAFPSGYGVPSCQGREHKPVDVSADDLITMQEYACAIGASVADL